MNSFKSLALAALTAGARATQRELSFPRIGLGYEPATSVTDHASIDLDQLSIDSLVGKQTTESFNAAEAVYRDGGNSKSYAQIQLVSGLASSVGAGAEVVGVNANGEAVNGKLLEDASSTATQIKVQYKTSDVPGSHLDCRVGGLPQAEQVTVGCLAQSGSITIDGVVYNYTYNVESDNNNARTIRGFSTGAKEKMFDCPGCPYPEYNKFYEYYGVYDYADKWILSAFDGTTTSGFKNYNANFGSYGLEGRAECAKKGTAYMSVLMYVIREFRDAVDDCRAGKISDNDDSVVAWDEGVAFYTGSLEGTDGTGTGVLIKSVVDKRCTDFKTCGTNGDEVSGTAKLNMDIFKLFSVGQGQIGGGKCDDLEKTVDRISQLMFVPMVQGTIRYAHKVDRLGEGEKSKAEGAVFAASVLPIVAACSPEDAAKIAANMQVGATATSYAEVVSAFEKNYGCMGISKADVGRLYDQASGDYYALSDNASASAASSFGAVGIAIGAVAAAISVVLL